MTFFLFYILTTGLYFGRWKAARRERKLLSRVRVGDEVAYRELVHELFDELFYDALQVVKSPAMAEKLVTKALSDFWYRLISLNLKSGLDESLKEILSDLTLKYLRQVARNRELRKELWQNMESCADSNKKRVFVPEYTLAIKYVRNSLLQKELLSKLTTNVQW